MCGPGSRSTVILKTMFCLHVAIQHALVFSTLELYLWWRNTCQLSCCFCNPHGNFAYLFCILCRDFLLVTKMKHIVTNSVWQSLSVERWLLIQLKKTKAYNKNTNQEISNEVLWVGSAIKFSQLGRIPIFTGNHLDMVLW